MDSISVPSFYAILWVATIGSITATLFRALNLGYHRSSYMITFLCSIPITIQSFNVGGMQMGLMNLFYSGIALLGYYRYKKHSGSGIENKENNERIKNT